MFLQRDWADVMLILYQHYYDDAGTAPTRGYQIVCKWSPDGILMGPYAPQQLSYSTAPASCI